MRGEEITVGEMLDLFFPEAVPQDPEAAVQAVLQWVRCGREPGGEQSDGSPPYDLLSDGETICAAFLREYGIDITTAELHWWRFMALLWGTLEPHFDERVKIRRADLGKIKDRERRVQVQRLKEAFALDRRGLPMPAPKTLEEYEALLLAQARGER